MAVQDQIPRSRITLKYRTRITGETEDVELPFRMLVLGDFSQVPADQRTDIETRQIRGLNGTNLDAVMESMDLKVETTVPALGGGSEAVSIPIRGMSSFDPGAVAQHVPSVKSLLLMRQLLTELRSSIANQREFRKELKRLFSDDEIKTLKSALGQLKFDAFDLKQALAAPPEASSAPAKAAPAGEAKP